MKVKFKMGSGTMPSTIENGALLFNYTEGKVYLDNGGTRYDLNTASKVDVTTQYVNDYLPIVTHDGSLLKSAGADSGKPRYNASTGDLKATSFTAEGGGGFTGDLIGNANTATTASKLGTSTVGNENTPIYLSNGEATPILSIIDTTIRRAALYNKFDAYLAMSPIQLATSNVHSANRLAFAKAAGITIEYSTDGGTTWIDYGLSDAEKIELVSGKGAVLLAGKGLSSLVTANDKLRITLHATDMGLYTSATHLLVNVSTGGSIIVGSNGVNVYHRINVDIEKALRGSETNFSTWATEVVVSGWSGWNNIPLNGIPFGGASHQTSNIGAIRLTFYSDGASPNYTSGAHFSVRDLYLIGSTYWSTPSTMAKTGHLYDYDADKNMILPGCLYPSSNKATDLGTETNQWHNVYAASFIGNATSATNLESDPSISIGSSNPNAIKVTAGNKTSNELVVPYALRAEEVAILTDAVNDYVPVVGLVDGTLQSTDTNGKVTCNFATGALRAETFTGNLIGTAAISETSFTLYAGGGDDSTPVYFDS